MAGNASEIDGMSFEPSSEVELIKDQISEFIAQEVEPLEDEYDQFLGEDAERHIVDDDERLVDEYLDLQDEIHQKSREAGFYTMHMPEDVGGGGLNMLEYTMIREHIFNRNPRGFHRMIQDPGSVNWALISCYDDDYQREKYFEPVMDAEKHMSFALTEPEHGSDATWMDATGEKDGDEWVLNGSKAYIGNAPYCDFVMVFVRTSGDDGDFMGITGFLVDKDNPGLEVGKIHRTMGSQTGTHSFLHFNDCRVGEEQMMGDEGAGLMEMGMEWIGAGRLLIPASSVGRCQWMFDQCVGYAEDRKTFGKEIGRRQFVQGMLTEMRVDIEQVRWLYRYAAWKFDQGHLPRWLSAANKLRGSQLWDDVSDHAVQIHGGAGYTKSLPFEREYRDSRLYRIVEGTDEIQKRNIAQYFINL